MTAYDFESYHDRKRTRASKWVMMLRQNPGVREGIVPMTTADMDFMTAPEIVDDLLRYIPSELLGYSRPTDAYLDAILRWYRERHGYEAQRPWVLTSPGVVPALAAAVRTCAGPDEKVIVLTPIYGPFYDVIRGQGRRVADCPMYIRGNRYQIDFELFDRMCADEKPRLLLFCSPHNPSGRVWTGGELRRLAEICEKHGVRIASDEIHSDIILGERRHTVFNTVSSWAADAILCTSAGKAFNIQALQCANVFIRDQALRERFEQASLFAGIERANVLGMVATAAAYNDAGSWLEAVTRVICRNHDILLAFFARYPASFKAMRPDAGFLGWVDYSGTGIPRDAFLRFLIACDFYVTEGSAFGKAAENFIRVNVGLPTRTLQENLARLEKGLQETYGLVPE